jgi:hypothetical protein
MNPAVQLGTIADRESSRYFFDHGVSRLAGSVDRLAFFSLDGSSVGSGTGDPSKGPLRSMLIGGQPGWTMARISVRLRSL